MFFPDPGESGESNSASLKYLNSIGLKICKPLGQKYVKRIYHFEMIYQVYSFVV